MSEELFRKSSMDRVRSPEQLNDYIKVTNPSVWLVLTAVIVLLVGVLVWSVVGTIETTTSAVAKSDETGTVCYVDEQTYAQISAGMPVRIGDAQGTVVRAAEQPVEVTEDFDSYALHLGNLSTGQWVYPVTVDINASPGLYRATIVLGQTSPLSFVTN
jgi:hypothetical protein